jgi:TolA-binding protein
LAAPVIKNYKDQSIIYFEHDRSDEVYVLRSGRVILTYTPIDSKNEVKEDVRVGEFFGVKSAIGRFPREETAQVVGSASVLSFKLPDFEAFVSERTHLIIKMMKVFSNNLRQYHSKVREQLGQQGDAKSPAFELMNVAEVFYKNGQLEHAIYGFEKYLSHYPKGAYSARAQELLNLAKRSAQYPTNMPEITYEFEKKSVQPGSLQSEIETVRTQGSEAPTESPESLLKQAKSNFSLGDYHGAIPKLKAILAQPSYSEAEKQVVEEATLMLGNAQKNSKDSDGAFVTFSNFIKNYPRSEKVKEVMFSLGEVAESKNEVAKAIAIFSKVASMSSQDDLTQKAKQKIEALKG